MYLKALVEYSLKILKTFRKWSVLTIALKTNIFKTETQVPVLHILGYS